jgi:hypothetical protein
VGVVVVVDALVVVVVVLGGGVLAIVLTHLSPSHVKPRSQGLQVS